MTSSQARPLVSSVSTIVAMAATACGLLLILYPSDLSNTFNLDKPGYLSTAYLNAILASAPDDNAARLLLASNLMELGLPTQAATKLAPLLGTSEKADNLNRQILYAEYFATPSIRLREAIKAQLSGLSPDKVTDRDRTMARQLGLFNWLVSIEARLNHKLEAARLLVSADQPARALPYYSSTLSKTTLTEATQVALAAGQPQLALRWLNRFPNSSADYYQQKYVTAKMIGREDIAAHAADTLSELSNDPLKYQKAALASYIAAGQLDDAAQLSNMLIEQRPSDYKLRHKRWQISHWRGRPEEALSDAEWLLKRRFRRDIFKRTLNDAYALYQYPVVIRLFRLQTRHQRLTAKQFDLWMTSHQLEGTPEAALNDILRYRQRYGLSANELKWQARFLDETGQLEAQKALWATFEKSGNKDWLSLLTFARTFWLSGDYQQALDIVSQARQIPQDEEVEYWKLRGALAWQVGNRAEAALSYATLLQMGNTEPYIRQRHLQTGFSSDSQRLDWLWTSYTKHANDAQLTYLMQLAWNTGDQEALDNISAELLRINTPVQHAQAWNYMALHFQNSGRPDQALSIFDHLLEANPFDTGILINKGWLLLLQGDRSRIATFFHTQRHLGNDQNWQALMAALAEYLGEDRDAIALYLSLLADEPQNYAYTLSLTALLEKNQFKDAAARLHRYLISDLNKIPDTEYLRKSILIGRFFGPLEQSRQFAERLLEKGSLSDDELSQLYTTLLANDQAGFAQFYFGHQVWKRQRLPDWQQLQMALRDNGRHELAHLLASGSNLPPADSMTALHRIDRTQEALYLAQKTLLEGLSADAEQQVIDNWSGLRPDGFRAIQFDMQPEDPLNAQTFGVTFFWPAADWQWHSRIRHLDFADAGQQEFLSMSLGAGTKINQGRLRWRLSGDAGRKRNRYGLAVGLDKTVDAHWQFRSGLSLNDATAVNSAWRQSGSQNRLEGGLSYSSSARNQLSADLSLIDYNAPGGLMDTNAWQLNLRASEQWLFRRPNALSYLDIIWDKTRDQFIPAANDRRNQALIIAPYQRIAFGQRFWHGEVGQAPYTVASPHWYTDFSVGYQPENNGWDLGFSAGIGWRVVGDDELALRLNFQSDSRQQQQFSGVRLSYYLHY